MSDWKNWNWTPECFSTSEFITERDIWYKKLEEEGFNDIEAFLPGTRTDFPNLKTTSWSAGRALLKALRNGKSAYFYLATHYLTNGRFKSKTERAIWTRHIDGNTINEIMNYRRNKNHKKISKDTIKRTIRRIAVRMKEALKKPDNE